MTKCIRIPTQLAGLRNKTVKSLHHERKTMYKKYKVPANTGCPFDGDEPGHEDIPDPDPDDLFNRFRRRK